MRSKELHLEIENIISLINSSDTETALEKLNHISKVALYKTFKADDFFDYVTSSKPKIQLYEEITTWKTPNDPVKTKKKVKLSFVQDLIKRPYCSFAFMEVSREWAYLVVSEDNYDSDFPMSNYRYFGFKIQ